MNKRLWIVPILCLALAACGKKAPAETTPEPAPAPETTIAATTAPTETDLLTRYAWVRGEGLDLVGGFLDMGAQVEITGYTDTGLAQVKTSLGAGTVDPQFLRLSGDAPQWAGYARWNAGFFENWDLLGSPLELLAVDTQVQVLEELDKCYYVRYNDALGYIAKDQLSKYVYVAPGQSSDAGTVGDSSVDGDSIHMLVPRLDLLAQETGTAIVKVDRVPLVVGSAKLGQQVQLAEAEAPKGWTAILDGDATRYLPAAWLQADGEAGYEAWEGYAGYSCRLYDNIHLAGQPAKTVYLNAKVTVLWDAGSVSLIQFGKEQGYVSSGTLRQTPQPTQPPADSGSGSSSSGSKDNSSGSSSDSGGSTGGTTPGGSTSEGGWTPPVL